jgi:methionyl-tRNA formyltransferase
MVDPKVVLVGAVSSTMVALEQLIEQGMAPQLIITVPQDMAHINSDHVDLSHAAVEQGIELVRTLDVGNPECLKLVAEVDPDYIFVIGWSRLCSPEFLGLARAGVIGYHPTALPRMRGRSALSWTILLDVRQTAGTLFWIDEGIDTGDIAAQISFDVPPGVTLPSLLDLHLGTLARLCTDLIPRLKEGERPQLPQDHSAATYLAVRRPIDGLIDWTAEAVDIDRLVRAVTAPYPGAFTFAGDRQVMIWESAVENRPEWTAMEGQVFMYDNGRPIVRCGNGTTLRIEKYGFANSDDQDRLLTGQVRLGGEAVS